MTSPQTLAPPTKPGSPGNGGPIERSRPECLLRHAADLLQVDADGSEGLGVAFRRRPIGTSAHDLAHRGPRFAGVESQPGENARGQSGLIRLQAEQEVFGSEVAVLE